jgi:hypothetical protein
MCWYSAWLQGSERARVHRHYSSRENLCWSEKEFKWATLTQHIVVFCTCIVQNIFNYLLCFSFLYILFPSLAWIIWILQYCKTECHWRTFFLWPSYEFTFLDGSTYQDDNNNDKDGQHWIPIRSSEGVGMQRNQHIAWQCD